MGGEEPLSFRHLDNTYLEWKKIQRLFTCDAPDKKDIDQQSELRLLSVDYITEKVEEMSSDFKIQVHLIWDSNTFAPNVYAHNKNHENNICGVSNLHPDYWDR